MTLLKICTSKVLLIYLVYSYHCKLKKNALFKKYQVSAFDHNNH